MRYLRLLVVASFALEVCWAQSSAQRDEDGQPIPTFPKLRLSDVRDRIGRQFRTGVDMASAVASAGGATDDGVALGLIDALQRWADALEAQITMMRSEVLALKSSNRLLKDEVAQVRGDLQQTSAELNRLKEEVVTKQGSAAKSAQATDGKLDTLRSDLKLFSQSFSDFLTHYDTSLKEVKSNGSVLTGEVEWVKRSLKTLTSTVGASGSGIDTVRESVDQLTKSTALLSRSHIALDERIGKQENRTETYMRSVSADMHKLSTSVISSAFFNEAVANISKAIDTVRVNTTTLAFSLKASEQNLKLAVANATDDCNGNTAALQSRLSRLQNDFREQSNAVNEDFVSFRKSIDFAKGKYDELKNATDSFEERFDKQVEVRNNFTSAVLLAMNEFGSRMDDAETSLVLVRTQVEMVNASLAENAGKVDDTLTRIHASDAATNKEQARMNTTLRQYQAAAMIQANISLVLQDRLLVVEDKAAGIATNVSEQAAAVAKNSRQISGLEKHFVDAKSSIFELGMQIVGVKENLTAIDEIRSEMEEIRDDVSALSGSSRGLRSDVDRASDKMSAVKSQLDLLEESHVSVSGNISKVLDVMAAAHQRQRTNVETLSNRTAGLERGFAALTNFSSEVRGNLSKLLIFVAENKAGVLELKVTSGGLQSKVDQLFDLHDTHKDKVKLTSGHAAANISRLANYTENLNADLNTMNLRFEGIEKSLNNFLLRTEELDESIGRLHKDGDRTKTDIEAIRFDVASAKAGATGVDVFMSSIQNHIMTLTGNVTSLASNFTLAKADRRGLESRISEAEGNIRGLSNNSTLWAKKDDLAPLQRQIQTLGENSTSLKANIVGLGNFINSINSDLGRLVGAFEKYVGDVSRNIRELKSNVTEVRENVTDATLALRKDVEAVEATSSQLKKEMDELTAKTFAVKTSLFEQQNDLASLQADRSSLESKLDAFNVKFASSQKGDSTLAGLKAELGGLKNGLTSMTNSIFNIKSQIIDSEVIKSQMEALSANVSTCTQDVSSLRPQLEVLKQTLLTAGASGGASAAVSPGPTSVPRFSCAVTSDEIRVSGVIKFDLCNVNTDQIMTPSSGHVRIKDSGDYVLSLSANLVSVNSQAVWAAIYKQPAASEGWQVLGMINNYQKNVAAANVDDRDSGSISVIVPLAEGDKVWVEWRGYGNSFLYSNPYRLISFMGYMITRS